MPVESDTAGRRQASCRSGESVGGVGYGEENSILQAEEEILVKSARFLFDPFCYFANKNSYEGVIPC